MRHNKQRTLERLLANVATAAAAVEYQGFLGKFFLAKPRSSSGYSLAADKKQLRIGAGSSKTSPQCRNAFLLSPDIPKKHSPSYATSNGQHGLAESVVVAQQRPLLLVPVCCLSFPVHLFLCSFFILYLFFTFPILYLYSLLFSCLFVTLLTLTGL